MRFIIIIVSVTSIVMSVATIIDASPSHGKAVMCRNVAWTGQRAEDWPELNLCTHLILSHADIVPWDNNTGKYQPKMLMNVTHIRQMTILLGFHRSNVYYFNMTPEERSQFIKKSFDFLVRTKFDGLHMKYKIGHIYLDPLVHQKHTAFIKELKQKFNDKQLLLILSVESNKDDFFKGFDYLGIAEYVNFLHFQFGRGFNPSYENELQTRNIHDLEYVIGEMIKLGVPSTKMLIQIAFGGYEIRFPGKFSKEYVSSQQSSDYICSCALFRNYNFTYNSEFGVVVAANFLFESSRVIASKIRFAMRRNLAGALINDLDRGDHYNICEALDKDTYDDYKSDDAPITLDFMKLFGVRTDLCDV